MRPPARGAARALCGAAVAALLVSVAPPVGSAPLRLPAADGDKGQALPAMPSALDTRNGGASCVPASKERAKKQDWSRQRLDLDKVRRESTGAGVTVALIDTGVAKDAAGLDGRVTASGDAGEDCVGHGSFLAGLIAGDGGPRLAGVAPGAEILALRGTDRSGRAEASLVTSSVRAATRAGAGVIAIGVALPRRDKDLTRAIADARAKGAVVVAAATPDPPRTPGEDEIPPRPYWPAAEPGVLSVADMLPNGSRPKNALPTEGVDLAAPGAGVVSGGARGTGHYLGAGPSVAAAFTAGAAAVVRAARPDDSATEVTHRLTATAYPADTPQLDPYAAVTTVFGQSGASGSDKAAHPVSVRDTSDAERATGRATVMLLGGSAVVLLVVWLAFALPRARARGWRPAGQRTE
ncbi:S8 family serine peptidase [Streptomyces sp. NBC_00498]|uniref:S8 family serine peptidase n=1 Tax=Streptomyces sp. NBC_00498 TaxID=2975760 RepID=UPI002E16FE6E